jgi:hypothetical protein
MGRHAARHVDPDPVTEEVTFSRRSSRHRAPFAQDDPSPATEPLTFLPQPPPNPYAHWGFCTLGRREAAGVLPPTADSYIDR